MSKRIGRYAGRKVSELPRATKHAVKYERRTLNDVLKESTTRERGAWERWAKYYGYKNMKSYVADRYYLEEAPLGGEIRTP